MYVYMYLCAMYMYVYINDMITEAKSAVDSSSADSDDSSSSSDDDLDSESEHSDEEDYCFMVNAKGKYCVIKYNALLCYFSLVPLETPFHSSFGLVEEMISCVEIYAR